MFWIKKCIQKGVFGKEEEENWIKGVHSEMNSNKEKPISLYLEWIFMNKVFSLPRYTEIVVQDDFRQIIFHAVRKGDINVVTILAPLTENPNAPGEDGITPIYWAVRQRQFEIVKILAPLQKADNRNAPDEDGDTPIMKAACYGETEIVKILAYLTYNLNAANNQGYTPIHFAAGNGRTKIVKILAPLTNNPTASDTDGNTPIHWAA